MDVSRREALIAAGSFVSGGGIGYIASSSSQSDNDDLSSPVTLDNRPIIGSLDSEIKIVYWTDFECSFCQRFSQTTQPELIEKEVRNGRASMVFKPLGTLQPTSTTAAIASHCVYENGVTQEEYIDFKTELMSKFESTDGNREELIIDTATDYGVSELVITNCIEESKYIDKIDRDRREAEEWRFNATPHFLIFNSRTEAFEILTGSQPYTQFRDVIDSIS